MIRGLGGGTVPAKQQQPCSRNSSSAPGLGWGGVGRVVDAGLPGRRHGIERNGGWSNTCPPDSSETRRPYMSTPRRLLLAPTGNPATCHQTRLQAARFGMSCVMLTVMRANVAAIAFYARLGYKEHEDSPGHQYAEDAEEYVIMWKPLKKRGA